MIHVLSWNYDGSNDMFDQIADVDFEDQAGVAKKVGVSINQLKRMIRALKDDGMLRIYRYPNNNSIWCIGEDVDNLLNAHDAIATARYRKLLSRGADPQWFLDSSGEEQKNMLRDVPVFDSEREELQEDLGYTVFRGSKHLRKVEALPVDEELKEYVDKLWS